MTTTNALRALAELAHLHHVGCSTWSDQAVKHFGDKITCREGCPNCCDLIAYCTISEAVFVHLSPATPEQIEACIEQGVLMTRHLEAYGWRPYKGGVWDAARKVAVEKACGDWKHKALRCPFLGDDHRCSIYAWRPSQCSLTWSLADPSVCSRTHTEMIVKDDPLRYVHRLDEMFCTALELRSNHPHIRFLPIGAMLAYARPVLDKLGDLEEARKVIRGILMMEV